MGLEENKAVVQRLLDDYRGLPVPTRQPFQSEAIAILRIADGKVAEIWGTADRLGMLIQLGILPDIG